MVKQTAFCVLAWMAFLAGCESPEAGVGAPSQQAAEADRPVPEPAPIAAPAPSIIGCWADATPAAVETLTINADGTCADAVVAYRNAASACTWSTDGTALTFVYPSSSPACGYSIDGDTLVLNCPYMHEPQTYQRAACL